MKQLKLLFTVLFLAVLGLGNVWGADVTLGNWTSKPISGSNSISVTGTLTDSDSNSWNVSLTGSDASKNPSQSVSTGTTYWQLGANGNMTTAVFSTSAISGTITKIVVNCAAYSGRGTANVTVGGSNFGTQGQTIPTWSSNKGGDLTFTGSASGEIKVTLAPTSTGRAIYISSITVTYTTGSENPTVNVTGVSLDKSSLTLVEGATETLVATVSPDEATNKNVTWESNNESVATVANGVVTAKSAGSAVITVKSAADATKTATCNVTVNAFTPTANTYNIIPNNAFWGKPSQDGSQSITANTVFGPIEKYGINFTMNSKTSTNSYMKADHSRAYNGYTLTITAPDGFELTAIDFTGSTWAAPTASVGTMNNKSWTGNASEVTFTFSGTSYMTQIDVTYAEKVASSVATPELSVAAGTYEGTKNVKVSNYDAELSYYYTLDGTAPTNASTAYNHATGIDVTASATLKVIAYDAESNASDVASAAYTIIPVYTSITELLAAGDPTTTGWTVKITLTDVEITSFQGTKGVWIGAIQIYGDVTYPNTWAEGGTLSGTLTCTWKLYGTTKELCPSDWSNLEYTAPSTPVVTPEYASLTELIAAGAPTAGGKDVKVTFTNDIITRITDDRKGIFFMVGEQEVEVYCTTTCPTSWTANGQLSGTLVEGSWKLYTPRGGDPIWEIVVADWTAFEYTAYVSHVTGVTFNNGSVFAGKTLNLATLVEIAPADASNKNVSFDIVSGSEFISLSEGVVTGVAEGSAVVRVTTEDGSFTADATIAVEAVSVWATTYTSNVTLTANADTKASKEKVKVNDEETQYDALKCGTKSDDGSCKVILPLGTTKLHFHAVTWDGSSATATLSIKKVGNDTELFGNIIRPNTGFSGNNPYTLVGEPTDDYYCINFGSALTEATTLVFDASVNRFAIYGVNVETADVELLSIAVSGTPSQLEYYEGQPLATAGLIVTGTYNLGDPQTITEGISWNVTPTTLALGTTSVSVVATVGEISSEPYVVEGIQVNTLGDLGTAVIIVFPYNDSYYAMASDLTPVEVHMVNGKVVGVAEADRASLTWYKNEAESKATFQTIDGDYLAGSTKTNLETQATEYKWDVVDGHYQVNIAGTNRSFIYNGTKVGNYATSNVGNSGYSTYPIFATEFVDGEFDSRDLSNGMGTHCYPYTIKAGEYQGASFYIPAYRLGNSKLYWDEVAADEDIEAGKPYLVVPDLDSEEVIFVKQAETVGEPEVVDYGMVGNFTAPYMMVPANDNNYIVLDNQFRLAGNYVAIGQYRAYIHLEDVTDHAVAPAPGRRRIEMSNADAEVATGIENLNDGEPMKVLINGQVFILRGAKMYNAQGQLVK